MRLNKPVLPNRHSDRAFALALPLSLCFLGACGTGRGESAAPEHPQSAAANTAAEPAPEAEMEPTPEAEMRDDTPASLAPEAPEPMPTATLANTGHSECTQSETQTVTARDPRLHGLAVSADARGASVAFAASETELEIHRLSPFGVAREAAQTVPMSRARFLVGAYGLSTHTLFLVESVCNHSRIAHNCLYVRAVDEGGNAAAEFERQTGNWMRNPRIGAGGNAIVVSGGPMYRPEFLLEFSINESGEVSEATVDEGTELAEGRNPYLLVATLGAGQSLALRNNGRIVGASGAFDGVRMRGVHLGNSVFEPTSGVPQRLVPLGETAVFLQRRGRRATFATLETGSGVTRTQALTNPDQLPPSIRHSVYWDVEVREGDLHAVRRGPTLEELSDTRVSRIGPLRGDIGPLFDGAWTGEGFAVAWASREGRDIQVHWTVIRCAAPA